MIEKPESIQENIIACQRGTLRSLRKSCKICGGSGYKFSDDETKYENCKCTDLFESNVRYFEANIKERYLMITDEELQGEFMSDCYLAYKNLRDNIREISGKSNIFINKYGDGYSYGTSTVGYKLMQELVRLNLDCYCIDAQNIFDMIYSYSADRETQAKTQNELKYLLDVPNLFINDFSEEMSTTDSKNFAINRFTRFLLRRTNAGKFTAISTPLHFEEFKRKFPNILTNVIDSEYLHFSVRCIAGKLRKKANETLIQKLSDNCKDFLEYCKKSKPKKQAVEIPEEAKTEQPEEIVPSRPASPPKLPGKKQGHADIDISRPSDFARNKK